MSSPKLLVIVGPTAAGKSRLAMACAEALDGEIISADSVQVYRGLDIGSAKPTPAEQQRVRHWCIDVIDPGTPFDATMWCQLADEAIADIHARGKTPIVCGGTGFYIRVLLRGLDELPAISVQTRERVRAHMLELGGRAMHRRLSEVDPVAAGRIAPADEQRICRALEVYEETGKPLSYFHAQTKSRPLRYPVKIFEVAPPRERLHEKILTRAKAMWDTGLADEVARALDRGVSWQEGPLASACYRPVVNYHLQREQTPPVEAIAQAHRRYAKRQMTWLRGIGRRENDITKVDPADAHIVQTVLEDFKNGWEEAPERTRTGDNT